MEKRYFGAQTEKAITNFPFTFRKTPKEFIYAIAEIKMAAARAHAKAGELDRDRAQVIVTACDEILAGKHDDQFVLSAFQGGAGTSNHMNVNEVVANRATEILSAKGKALTVHPNDHVNMSHSTNDVMPSALKIVNIRLSDKVLGACDVLVAAFEKRAREYADVPKLGRTHMQDAVPTTFGAELMAYAEYIKRGQKRIREAREYLFELNLGGSAIGNSINASATYQGHLYRELQKVTRLKVRPAKNLMSQTSSDTDFVFISQALTALCADLSKMAGDFRILSSGPRGGFGEITLPELQPGSSIMPGKVNPVMPEALSQLYYLVSGNNLTIEHAAHGSQLELGVMLPVMTDRIVGSFTMADEMIRQFSLKCVAILIANEERMKELLERSTAYSVLLNPIIGYDEAAKAVKESLASGKTLREVVLEKKLLTQKEFDKITKLK